MSHKHVDRRKSLWNIKGDSDGKRRFFCTLNTNVIIPIIIILYIIPLSSPSTNSYRKMGFGGLFFTFYLQRVSSLLLV